MDATCSASGERSFSPARAAGTAAERRTLGRVAGVVIALTALVANVSLAMLHDRHVPAAAYVLGGVTLLSGLGCFAIPWDRVPAAWLHAIPAIATVEIALKIRMTGLYGDIAVNYYVFVGVFAAYAFTSRAAIAVHVGAASVASLLPLAYDSATVHPGARAALGVLMIVIMAGIVTVLREALQARQRTLEELAVRDPLTGVGNYRLLSERLDYEIARHRRSGGSLVVMLLDLDGFKAINDTLGHLVGDRVLIEVATTVAAAVRAQDTVARQGGDEFSILAPDTDPAQAEHLARRVEAAVRTATNGSVETSVGWVTFPADAEDPKMLLALADAELRRAKQARRSDRREQPPVRGSGPLRLVEPAG